MKKQANRKESKKKKNTNNLVSPQDHPGEWSWSDGSALNYTHWDEDQPE